MELFEIKNTEMLANTKARAEIATLQENYKDLHAAFVALQAEVADLKSTVTSLDSAVTTLTQKLVAAGYVK